MRVCLQNGGSGSRHFSSFTSEIGRSTYSIKTPMGGWEFRKAGQRSLSGGLPGAIDIHHLPVMPLAIEDGPQVERSALSEARDPPQTASAVPPLLVDPGPRNRG